MTAAAGAQFRIRLNTSGQVFIQRGTSTTILATSALGEPVFAANVWYYLEVAAFVHDTTGFVRVYRDGVLAGRGRQPEYAGGRPARIS